MASFLPVFLLFIVTIGAMLLVWFITPKGPQQTYVFAVSTHLCRMLIVEPLGNLRPLFVQTDTVKSPAHVYVLLYVVGYHVHGAIASHDRYVRRQFIIFTWLLRYSRWHAEPVFSAFQD
jgi:hypothetical protein